MKSSTVHKATNGIDSVEERLVDLQLKLAPTIGQEFFNAAAKALTELIEADYTIIGTVNTVDYCVDSIALCSRDGLEENIKYFLKGTPCENLLSGKPCVFNGGVAEKFPEDILLAEIGVESFIGIPLTNHQEEVIGLIVGLYTTKIKNPDFVQDTFRVIAERTTSELERSKMEFKLKEQKDRLKFALHAGQFGVYTWEIYKDELTFNDKIYEIIGYSREEFGHTYMDWIGLVHPDDYHQLAVDRNLDYLDGKEYHAPRKLRIKRKNGVYTWVQIESYSYFIDLQKQLKRNVGIVKQIDKEVNAERELNQSLQIQKDLNEKLERREKDLTQKQYRLVSKMVAMQELNKELKESRTRWAYALEGNGDGVIEWDLKTNKLYLSKRSLDILGYPKGVINTQEDLLNIIHPHNKTQLYTAVDQSKEKPYEAFQVEIQVKDLHDQFKWLMLRGKVVKLNPMGKPKKIVGTITDLSEQKISQKELTIYEEMIKQNQTAILFVSLDGVVEFANKMTITFLQAKQHQVIGAEVRKFFKTTHFDTDSNNGLFHDIFQGEQELQTINGEIRVVEVITSLLKIDNLESGYVVNFVDVTDKKELEDKVTKLTFEKLEQDLINQKKQTEIMIHVQENEKQAIARELHDGIGQLLSLARMQLTTIESDLPQKKQVQLHNIQDLLTQINVDIKGLTGNLMPLSVRKMGLEAALVGLLERFHTLNRIALKSKIELNDLHLSEQTSTHIYRIVQEALNNTYKYSQASEISIMAMKLKNSLNIIIEDNGKGFDMAANMKKENSFGLKTMRERAKLISAKLIINSVPDIGTAISLTVPINQA